MGSGGSHGHGITGRQKGCRTMRKRLLVSVAVLVWLFCLTACQQETAMALIPWEDEVAFVEIVKHPPSPPETHRITDPQEIAELAAFVNGYQAEKIQQDPFGGWDIQLTVRYRDHSHEDVGFCVSGDILSADTDYRVGENFRAQLLEWYELGEPVENDLYS